MAGNGSSESLLPPYSPAPPYAPPYTPPYTPPYAELPGIAGGDNRSGNGGGGNGGTASAISGGRDSGSGAGGVNADGVEVNSGNAGSGAASNGLDGLNNTPGTSGGARGDNAAASQTQTSPPSQLAPPPASISSPSTDVVSHSSNVPSANAPLPASARASSANGLASAVNTPPSLSASGPPAPDASVQRAPTFTDKHGAAAVLPEPVLGSTALSVPPPLASPDVVATVAGPPAYVTAPPASDTAPPVSANTPASVLNKPASSSSSTTTTTTTTDSETPSTDTTSSSGAPKIDVKGAAAAPSIVSEEIVEQGPGPVIDSGHDADLEDSVAARGLRQGAQVPHGIGQGQGSVVPHDDGIPLGIVDADEVVLAEPAASGVVGEGPVEQENENSSLAEQSAAVSDVDGGGLPLSGSPSLESGWRAPLRDVMHSPGSDDTDVSTPPGARSAAESPPVYGADPALPRYASAGPSPRYTAQPVVLHTLLRDRGDRVVGVSFMTGAELARAQEWARSSQAERNTSTMVDTDYATLAAMTRDERARHLRTVPGPWTGEFALYGQPFFVDGHGDGTVMTVSYSDGTTGQLAGEPLAKVLMGINEFMQAGGQAVTLLTCAVGPNRGAATLAFDLRDALMRAGRTVVVHAPTGRIVPVGDSYELDGVRNTTAIFDRGAWLTVDHDRAQVRAIVERMRANPAYRRGGYVGSDEWLDNVANLANKVVVSLEASIGESGTLDLVRARRAVIADGDSAPRNMWSAALSVVAASPTLASKVSTVVDLSNDEGYWDRIRLEPLARSCYVVTGWGEWDYEKRVGARSARMVRPGEFGVDRSMDPAQLPPVETVGFAREEMTFNPKSEQARIQGLLKLARRIAWAAIESNADRGRLTEVVEITGYGQDQQAGLARGKFVAELLRGQVKSRLRRLAPVAARTISPWVDKWVPDPTRGVLLEEAGQEPFVQVKVRTRLEYFGNGPAVSLTAGEPPGARLLDDRLGENGGTDPEVVSRAFVEIVEEQRASGSAMGSDHDPDPRGTATLQGGRSAPEAPQGADQGRGSVVQGDDRATPWTTEVKPGGHDTGPVLWGEVSTVADVSDWPDDHDSYSTDMQAAIDAFLDGVDGADIVDDPQDLVPNEAAQLEGAAGDVDVAQPAADVLGGQGESHLPPSELSGDLIVDVIARGWRNRDVVLDQADVVLDQADVVQDRKKFVLRRPPLAGEVAVPAGQVPHRLLRHNGLLVRLDFFRPSLKSPLSGWLLKDSHVRVRVEEMVSYSSEIVRHYYWTPSAALAEDVLVVGLEVRGDKALINVPGWGKVEMKGYALARLLQFVGALTGHQDGALIFLAVVADTNEARHEKLAASLQKSMVELGYNRRVAIGTKPASLDDAELVVRDGGHVRILGAIDKEALAEELAQAHKLKWSYQPDADRDVTSVSLNDHQGALTVMRDIDIRTAGMPAAETVLEAFRTLRRSADSNTLDVLLLAVARKRFGITTMADLWTLLASAPISVADLDEVRHLATKHTVEPTDERIGYDVSRVEVYPGIWMREVQLTIQLNYTGDISREQRAGFWRNLVLGVDRAFDQTLPQSGDRFRVQLLRTESGEDAHVTLQVAQADSGATWRADASPEQLSAHIASLLGGPDPHSIERLAPTEELHSVPYSQLRTAADWNQRLVSGQDAAGRERRFPVNGVLTTPLASGDRHRGTAFPSQVSIWSPGICAALAESGVTNIRLAEEGADRTMDAALSTDGYDLFLLDADQNSTVVTVESIGEVRLNGAEFASVAAAHLRYGRFGFNPVLLITPLAGALNRTGGFAFDLHVTLKRMRGAALVAAPTHGANVLLDQHSSPTLVVSNGGHLNLFPKDRDLDREELTRALERDWAYAPSEPKPAGELLSTSDRAATIALIKETVDRIRGVVSENGGLLHLWALRGEVRTKHQQPNLVVVETLRHISIAHTELRDQIIAVVDQILEDGQFGDTWRRMQTGDLFTVTGKAVWDYEKGEVRRPVRLNAPGQQLDVVWDLSGLDTVVHFDTSVVNHPFGLLTLKEHAVLQELAMSIAEVLVEHRDAGRPLPVLRITGHGRMSKSVSMSSGRAEAEANAKAKGRRRAEEIMFQLRGLVPAYLFGSELFGAYTNDRSAFQEFIAMAELDSVAEPWHVDRGRAARVEIRVVLRDTLARECRDRGDVAGLVELRDRGVEIAHAMLVNLAREGNAEALRFFTTFPENHTRALADLASAGIAQARETLYGLARDGNVDAIGELARNGDVQGLDQAGSRAATDALQDLALGGNALAVQVFVNRGTVPRLERLAAAQVSAARTALVDLAITRDEDAISALVRLADVPGLVAASSANVNLARASLMFLAGEGNREAREAISKMRAERS
ncbi:hypothetical protein ABZX92_39415 [Lentzea sp. NPDC006480]|uniref:hypothetical protein n=1 Tax=Lentzea sp. NPDC006480 TaxID=3157176 RepID=UPI0033AFED9C